MAEGRSNAGIAAGLVVTAGPVERGPGFVTASVLDPFGNVFAYKHVANIFDKRGLPPDETDNRRVLAVLRYLGS